MDKNQYNITGLTEEYIKQSKLYADFHIGRVSSQYKDLYKVLTENGELAAEISGKLRFEASSLPDYPAVGDFVMLDRLDNKNGNAIIHKVLARKSSFERKAAGTGTDTQVIAANIDIVFICMSLNNDFNLRRLERYLSIAWSSRAIPVVVLTKSDLCDNLDQKLTDVYSCAIGVDVIVTSSVTDIGYEALKGYITAGKTIAFIGSSGVGKSTLINRLIGEDILDTFGIRKDDRGRHTTTRRELITLPSGAAVIDTPGMRELGLESADLSKTFTDIDELSAHCKFHDCTHTSEPGCAVRQAMEVGILTEERLASYNKLKKESKYEGMDSRQIENEKITSMFGGMAEMKNARRLAKEKNNKKNKY